MSSIVISGDTSGAITLAAPAVSGTNTATFPAATGTVALLTGTNASSLTVGTTTLGAGNASIMKNRIINGAMVIDQRNAGASATLSNTGYSLDRWQTYLSPASKYTVQQNAGSVTPPTGFTNYLGVTSTSAYSVSGADYQAIVQPIEGYNVADLDFGKSTAKTVTISFWVRSSLTGTFGGALANNGASRSYPYTYTISSANTWEQKSVTIAGDTAGTWNSVNGPGIVLLFGLGVGTTYSGTAGSWASANYMTATGATSVVGTNGATFYITGVQLEVGSSATGFEYRQYQQELALCQRYYQLAGMGGSYYSFTSGQQARYSGTPIVTPRTSPTFTLVTSNVVGNVSSATPSSYNSGATIQLQISAVGGTGFYVDANYTYSLSAEL